MADSPSQPLISSFSVEKLFGRRSYAVTVPVIDGAPSRLVLIHGPNGSGKTTVLRLIWHALSAAENQGHRSYLAKTQFSRLTITMTDHHTLIVQKLNGLTGSFTVHLSIQGETLFETFYEESDDQSVRSPSMLANTTYNAKMLDRWLSFEGKKRNLSDAQVRRLTDEIELRERYVRGEQNYLSFLRSNVGNALYLADDRILYTDDFDTIRLREALSRRDERDRKSDRIPRLAFVELQITMRRVNEHLRSLTLGGQSEGSANNNAIYLNVLKQLVNPSGPVATNQSQDIQQPLEWLNLIGKIAPLYEEFELVPHFDIKEFRRLLTEAERSGLGDLAARVTLPFLSSLHARYQALAEAQLLLRNYIPTVNNFLSEKFLSFSPKNGLSIRTKPDGEILEVESLSSGERQLLTLLSNTILAREDTRLFIIDEPELSLGVEWQRAILNALTGLTDNSAVQFFIATHSIEIVSSRPEALVELRHS